MYFLAILEKGYVEELFFRENKTDYGTIVYERRMIYITIIYIPLL